MKEQLIVQKILHQKLMEAQSKNSSYSLRSFSKKLGIGAGPLSQILSGSRKISVKMAERLCDSLMLDPQERSEFLRYFKGGTSASLKSDEVDYEEFLKLSGDQFKVISEWYYFGILSLTLTRGFKNDATWVSKRLGITRIEASQALDRLFRLGMLETENGKVKRNKPKYRTSDDVTNLSIRKAHFQTLEMAKKSLERDPVERRDFTTITIPTHPKKIKEAKELIRKFQNDLCGLMMDTPEKTEVYKLSMELFPLTQVQNEKR
jgi:uncharacterized protein (TIGR02147 family)